MERPLGRMLTSQEKEKLREKLALLKREYSKTLNRLQRAERAEKFRNHLKKSVAEQNELLMQEKAENSLAESTSQTSPAKASAGTFLELSAADMLSISFALEPEVCSQEGSLPDNTGSEFTSLGLQRTLFGSPRPVPEEKQVLLSRRRSKLRRIAALAALEKGGESACEVLQKDGKGQSGGQTASVEVPGSPVFKRNSGCTLELDQSILTASSVAAAEESGLVFIESELETSGEVPSPGLSKLLPCGLSQESQRSLSEHQGERGTLAHLGALGGGESAQAEKGQAWVGEEDDVHRPAEAALANEAFQGAEMLKGTRQSPVDLGAALGHRGTPIHQPGEEAETGSPLLEKAAPATTPTQSPLSSCTVIEGLLFPLEYYVRTTRRMSSCPREVNLEAVIESQLRNSRRRRQRVARKERSATPALPSSEPMGREDPCLAASADASPRGQVGLSHRQGLPSSLSHESTAASEGLTRSEVLAQHRRAGRLRRRAVGRPGHRTASRWSPERVEDSGPGTPKESSCLLPEEVQESGQAGEEAKGRTGRPLAARAHVAAEPSGQRRLSAPVHSADRCPKAEPEAMQGSSTACLGPEPASSVMRGMRANRKVRHSEGRRQDGIRGHAGATPACWDAAPPLPPDGSPPGAGLQCKRGNTLPQGIFWTDGGTLVFPSLVRNELVTRKWLPAELDLQEFHLPEDEFGFLKSQKLNAGAVKPLEMFEAAEEGPSTGGNPGNVAASLGSEQPALLATQQALPEDQIPTSKWLLSPAQKGAGSSLLDSQLPTPMFPVVGATPAAPTASSPDVSCPSPLQAKAGMPVAAPSTFGDTPALPSAGREERACSIGESSGRPGDSQLPAGGFVEPCKESPHQDKVAAANLGESQRDRSLQLTSKLKNFSGCCSVDVGTVWWEAAADSGSSELCLVTACETSVSLWKHLDPSHWEAVHTWHLAEVPVIQIIPLPGVKSHVCVALGRLEITEIRLLFHSSEDGCTKQSLVKAGNIQAVLGLKDRQLVSSCGSLHDQEVEVAAFSEAGRTWERRDLMPPKEALLAFAEVAGMQEALVGMTAVNCVVVWNLRSGQLLRKVPVGCSGPAAVCHRAYSDSGLLFVVLSHPHAEESKSCGSPAFRVVALNPKTARSAEVLLLSVPLGIAGRYLEGDVRDTSAAAVLTSGVIAVWDLLLGQCTALLPPSPEGSWSLVRWSGTDACLLAGQKDGSVCIYSYAVQGLPAL